MNVWQTLEAHQATGMLAAHAVTAIYYLLSRKMNDARATAITLALLSVVSVATVDQRVIRRAFELGGEDFEDAVTAESAAHIFKQ